MNGQQVLSETAIWHYSSRFALVLGIARSLVVEIDGSPKGQKPGYTTFISNFLDRHQRQMCSTYMILKGSEMLLLKKRADPEWQPLAPPWAKTLQEKQKLGREKTNAATILLSTTSKLLLCYYYSRKPNNRPPKPNHFLRLKTCQEYAQQIPNVSNSSYVFLLNIF